MYWKGGRRADTDVGRPGRAEGGRDVPCIIDPRRSGVRDVLPCLISVFLPLARALASESCGLPSRSAWLAGMHSIAQVSKPVHFRGEVQEGRVARRDSASVGHRRSRASCELPPVYQSAALLVYAATLLSALQSRCALYTTLSHLQLGSASRISGRPRLISP